MRRYRRRGPGGSWGRFEGYIPAGLVKEYLWCPAFAWLSWNGPGLKPPPHAETEWRLDVREAASLAESLGHRGRLIAEAPLRSDRLRVAGRVDYLVEPEGGSPGAVFEVKARGRWGSWLHYDVQAALYAMMAEEAYGAPFKAYIVSQTEVREVPHEARAAALRALAELRETLAAPAPPEPGHDLSRCRSCAYRRLCPWAPAAPG